MLTQTFLASVALYNMVKILFLIRRQLVCHLASCNENFSFSCDVLNKRTKCYLITFTYPIDYRE